MNWTALIVFAAALALLILSRRAGLVSMRDAREHLSNGALVIDVRTGSEYASGHLPKSLNVPLDQIEGTLAKRAPDKNTTLLLHCQAGSRSRVATRLLRAQGYKNAWNMGSLRRAQRIVEA